MPGNVKTGNGATVTIVSAGADAFSLDVKGISALEETIEALEDSDLSSTQMEYCAADLAELGQINLRVRWDNSKVAGTQVDLGHSSTIVVTFPLLPGEVTAATLTGTGFIAGRTGPELENNQIAEGTIAYQFDGGRGGAQQDGTALAGVAVNYTAGA